MAPALEGGDTINPLKIMAWAVDTKLPQAQKLVLLLLAHYSDKDMTCYPGQTRLADQAGMSDRNVRRAVSELEAKGLIYRQKRFRKDGTRTSDLYHLNVGSQPVDNS